MFMQKTRERDVIARRKELIALAEFLERYVRRDETTEENADAALDAYAEIVDEYERDFEDAEERYETV